jgi:two-component system alkaline phosphatase synthesis response regulator PhoP
MGSDTDDNYIRALSLNAGADAFLKKPYDAGLLKATLNAVKRRIQKETKPEISGNEPVISLERHLVVFNGNEISLPRKEFEIFALLYFNRGNVLTRDTIIHKIWKDKKSTVNPRTIDVHIRKLREQIGERFIHTIKGVGYKYKPA